MIKKHKKRSIYATYQSTFLKQLLKKTFEATKENPNIEGNLCVLLIKCIKVVQLLVRPDRDTRMIEITVIYA